MTNQISILNRSIRQSGNLYSLTDLHKASGYQPKHQPTYFLRNDQTKELIAEIEAQNGSSANSQSLILSVKNGVGTYACEELALAYAMWISPKFHLVVLRAFLAMHKQQTQPQQIALPTPEPTFTFEFSQKNIHDLVWLLYSQGKMNWLLGRLVKPLELIGSSFSPAVYGNHTEYQRHYRNCLPLMQQLIEPLKQANPQEWQQLQYRLTDK